MLRFIHSADVHLGKPFGFLDDEAAPLLRDARFEALSRLAELACEHGAFHILLAGDTFDAVQIGNATLDRAIDIMGRRGGVRWHLIPGNHDFHQPHGLWDRAARKGLPSNVRIHLERVPVALEADDARAFLLPAPLFHAGSADDPTAWMDAPTPEGALRIGLAHGAVTSFEEGTAMAPIPPDRTVRSGLDYLALGDWHRRIEVNPRTFYAGTPEPDSFRRAGDDSRCNGGEALLVELSGPGSPPMVTPLSTGRYTWHQIETRLHERADVDALAERIEALGLPERLLVDLSLEGVISLGTRDVLEDRIIERFGATLRWLRVRDPRLLLEPDDADLASMGENGLVRTAAERLQGMVRDCEPEQARLARLALKTLYLEHVRMGA